jgi:zinc-ribbon domain
MPKRFCTSCGAEASEDDRFCGTCGGSLALAESSTGQQPAVAAASPATGTNDVTAPQQPIGAPAVGTAVAQPIAGAQGWWSQRRNRIALGVLAVALVAGAAIGSAFALGANGGNSSQRVAAKTPETTSSTLSSAQQQAQAAYKDYVTRLENILQQSTAGRGQVGSLVTGVENGCQVAPESAAPQIQSVIDNRTSVLNQLAGLATAPNPTAQNLYSLLQQSIQSSINADTQYKAWMDYLYFEYYYTYPVGCPGGSPPQNDSFYSAQSADSNSTNLKTEFVAAFNPVATNFGLQTWDPSSF